MAADPLSEGTAPLTWALGPLLWVHGALRRVTAGGYPLTSGPAPDRRRWVDAGETGRASSDANLRVIWNHAKFNGLKRTR